MKRGPYPSPSCQYSSSNLRYCVASVAATFTRSIHRAVVCGALLSTATAGSAYSLPVQTTEQSARVISGTVTDATGGAIGGATVTLTTNLGERKTVSDARGTFVFDHVSAGSVTLTVAFERFAPLTLTLNGPRQGMRIVLQPVPVAETVTVRARPPNANRITTATRTDTPLRDVPQSITVVTHDVIADLQMQNMADVVRYVPGVAMAQGEGNRDAPILRGHSTTADFFVDGVRDDVQYFRDLYNVERVEALKGPNAMIFGRGGAGGVINRATKQADWLATREITLQGGSYEHRRATVDLDHPLTSSIAARVTGLYENSGSYRRAVSLERYAFNPTVAFRLRDSTTIKVGYERFHDQRTADRGIPSFGNRPVASDPSTFFGDPTLSHTHATVNAWNTLVERTFRGNLVLRNRTRLAAYEKFYQNVFPGSAVSADGRSAPLSAYNDSTERHNLFNQLDLTLSAATGRIKHRLLAGAEVGRQVTDNLRNTGYFVGVSPNATSFQVSVTSPTVSVPVMFRQSATDANNHGVATVAAVYAQDHVELSPRVQAIVGLRYDRFDVDFRNHRTAADFTSTDNLLSPRAGLIYRPAEPVSLYASYGLAYLPRAGDQLSSLSLTNQALDPEKFTNYEVGVKWDAHADLSLTTAVYQLDRTNVLVPDPSDPTRSMLVNGQRTKGVEFGLTGNVTSAWSTMAGYAYQNAKLTRTLSATAQAGAVLAQVPAHTFSLWNRFNLASRWGVGLGIIHNSDRFTSTDNTVVLPKFTRVDGALFLTLTRQLRMQVNVENLFDERYYASAHNNNNITPGSPRAARIALTTRF